MWVWPMISNVAYASTTRKWKVGLLPQVKKAIKDVELENEILNKHFHLMQVKRKNQLMTRGIENTHDELE